MSVSKEEIQYALQLLDPTNDAHWTTDDQPRLDVVKEELGGRAVSRDEVTLAAPGFSRKNPEAGFGETVEVAAQEVPEEAVEELVLEGDPTEAVEVPDEVPEEVPVETDLTEDEKVEKELAEAREAMNDAVARFSRARDAMDAVIAKRESQNNQPLSVMVRQYHASVKKQRGILD